jgi:hypothetical protein
LSAKYLCGIFVWDLLHAFPAFEAGYAFAILLLLPLVGFGMGHVKLLRKQLLLMGEYSFTRKELVPSEVAWTMFAEIVVVTPLRYGLFYNPAGTHKPEWTNNLG